MSHESSGSGQHQDAGAEVLVERQEQSPDVSGELGEEECQESKGPLRRKILLYLAISGDIYDSNLTTKENSSQQSHPAVQGVHVRLGRHGEVVAVESGLG